jgi:hypothetical protein
MRLVKFTRVDSNTGDEGLIWINPEQVARVIPKATCVIPKATSETKVAYANTRISVAGTSPAIAFWVKETPDEVVAALTGSPVAVRLAAKL